jgi:ABC-type branched-subunit amino acid transport system substrate-binding protein
VYLFCLLGLCSAGWAASPFRIGWNTELSGPFTFAGMACLDAARLAEAEVNASGKKIELIVRDNQTNPAQAAAVARALDSEDKVDLLSGPTNADVSLAAYGYAEQNGLPYLVPVASFPQLTQPGTKQTFRMEPDSVGWGYALVKFLKKMKPDAKIGIMVNDFAINRAIVAGFKYQAPKDGLTIVEEVIFPQTATDATVQVAQMKAKRPDFVLVSGAASAFDATLTAQLLDMGFKSEQLVHPFGTAKVVLNWGSRSASSYFGTFFDQNLATLTDGGRAFVKKFREVKGYSPGFVENYCYNTVRFVGELVERGAHDRATIHEAIRTAKTKEITTGIPIYFDQNGARIAYMYLMQIESMTKDDFIARQVDYLEWEPEVVPVYDLMR